MDKVKLSILVCTTDSRVGNFLPVIVDELTNQAKGKPVEVLWLGDNTKRTVGEKRNNLIDVSNGEYFAFVDDDDRVAPTYIDDLLRQVNKNPDLVVFMAYRRHNGKNDRPVHYDISYLRDENKESRYQRRPNHLMCWKKSKVSKVRFRGLNFGEDGDWSERVVNLCDIKVQKKINKILYYYDFNVKTTETQNF